MPISRLVVGFGFAIGAIALLVVDAYVGRGVLVAVAVSAMAGLGLWEFLGMARGVGYRPFRALAILAGAIWTFAVWGAARGSWTAATAEVLGPALVIALAIVMMLSDRRLDRLPDGALTALGFVYIPMLMAYFVRLRGLDTAGASRGTLAIIAVIAAAKLNDVAAYFVGRAVGRTKLAPELSPGKTLEGAAAGLVAGTVTGLVLAAAFGLGLGVWRGLLFGLIVTAAAIGGDIVESLFKRQFKAKDSGRTLRSAGGFLDVIDSLLTAAPAGWFALVWLGPA